MWEALAMADGRKPKEQQGLPEGWKWVKLGEVIEDIADGGTPSRDNPEYFNGNINWLVVDDIQRKIVKTRETITAKGLKHSNAKLWKKGTIILSFGATIGEVGIAEIELATKQGIAGIVPQKDKLLNTFLYYVLKHNKHILLRYANQTTIMEVRPSVIKEKFKFPLPPLPEQRKIAQILETVDNAIEKTEKIIEKYKRIKQGLMQDLLTKGIDEKGNIRSEKTHKFKDSSLGRIPEEWEVVRLGEILKYEQPQKYIVISDEYDEKSGIPVLTAGKTFILGYVDENEGICNDLPVILFDDFTTDSRYINFPFKVKSSATKILRARDESIDLFYVYNALQLIRLKPGSDHKRFWISEYSKMFIPLPPLSEQKRIAEILSQIDQAIEKEEKYKQKLERLKKGLMEDLLTGKVRVNKLLEGKSHEMA
jgi:type I restriction enzyme S subunit